MSSKEAIELSIVATVYNHSSTVPRLVEELKEHVEPLGIPYEILLVDDGSRDDAEKVIAEQCARHPEVRGVYLARNYGQQIAASAGILEARGAYVVVMDGDLQNPPCAVPLLYDEIRKGYDIVYTVSTRRKSVIDELTSRLFWFIVNRLLGLGMYPHQLMMKIMSRRFVDAFREYRELSRVVAGITEDIGMRRSVIAVDNRRRAEGGGISGYTSLARFELFIDILISLSARPLTWLIYVGLLGFAGSSLLVVYYLLLYAFRDVPSGYTSIIVVILFFGSLNTLMIGLMCRYLYVIYNETRRRPLYFCRARRTA